MLGFYSENKLRNKEEQLLYEIRNLCSNEINEKVYEKIEFPLEDAIYFQVRRNLTLRLKREKKYVTFMQ